MSIGVDYLVNSLYILPIFEGLKFEARRKIREERKRVIDHKTASKPLD